MASIVLGAAGAAIGASIPVIGPFVGATLGRAVGSALGGAIDSKIFGTSVNRVEGARLENLAVQASTYGKDIPIVYGSMRLAGNIIWSQPIKETASTSSSGGGKGFGGGGQSTSVTSYSYSISLAVAICEGEIHSITRIWADAKLLDLSLGTYRIYNGSETQLPDTFIEAIEGTGNSPAYRGLAYIVVEDFPLADFGNRIPNFTFEVKRPVQTPDYGDKTTEEMVNGMTMIPGAGEFVYDTIVQKKLQGEYTGFGFAQSEFDESINKHTPFDASNAIVSLDQLQETCPNVSWVSVVVTWFGDSLDAGQCRILPGVEFKDSATTTPDIWHVADFTRDSARQITIENGTPRYGGTPSDASILRYIDALKARGYNVMLYPMFFMDVERKPWRGRVTGTASGITTLFDRTDGLNRMVLHYANLAKNKVDAFVIGSELIGLTSVADNTGQYPAVTKLMNLAQAVKNTMGAGTKVTYAADWSEYHHTEGGWYNLDPLWASPYIDFIGIDAYFPLSEGAQSDRGYEIQTVIDGWDSGEHYDYIYNADRSATQAVQPAYALKNIDWFWRNTHINPDGQATPWQPQSKKIWFTEYGFPSVDAATNQPNVFYDPSSSESFFPRGSNGSVDFRAQRQGITATLARWQDSDMLENLFLWTWDARPFPYFPDLLNVWADGNVWATGHWVTGKFGISSLAAIIRDLALRAGLRDEQIDVSRLTERVDGYVIAAQGSARGFIEELMSAYFFDAIESGEVLKFLPRGGIVQAVIDSRDLVREGNDTANEVITKTHAQEVELPRRVDIVYLDRTRNYQSGTQTATRQATNSRLDKLLGLPIVMSAAEAFTIGQKHLYLQWTERTHFRFALDNAYASLEPTDVVRIVQNGVAQDVRIVRSTRDAGAVTIDAVAENIRLYEPVAYENTTPAIIDAVPLPAKTTLALLDIPALPGDAPTDATLRAAALGSTERWRGAVLYRAQANAEYEAVMTLEQSAIMGVVIQPPPAFDGNCIDETSTFEVRLLGQGSLQSVTQAALLNGANSAVVGDEIIQFQYAEMLDTGKYRLSRLLRGRLGSESYNATHQAGEQFVLINNALSKDVVSSDLFYNAHEYKAVTYGATFGSTQAQSFTYHARALKPYAPVHLQLTTVNDDIILTWVRRDRLYGAWQDGMDAGLSEVQERYRITCDYGSGVRIMEVTITQILYTAQMQIDDTGGLLESGNFTVQQLSTIVGAGHPASIMFG